MLLTQHDDSERGALIRLRNHLAATRASGVLARIRRWDQVRRADWMLEYEDARRDGSDVLATQRRWTYIGIPLMLGAAAIQALFFPGHVLTLGRAAWVLALDLGGAAGLLAFSSRPYRRQERQLERVYLRWLERARALPPSGAEHALGQPNAAV
jgi:hypothetical protein